MRNTVASNTSLNKSQINSELDFNNRSMRETHTESRVLNSTNCMPPVTVAQPDDLDDVKNREVNALRSELKRSSKEIKTLQAQVKDAQKSQADYEV
jgi:hypothetical protein